VSKDALLIIKYREKDMKLETLEALQSFVMAVKHSPATESDLDLMLAGDELDSLLESEIEIQKKLSSAFSDKDLPEFLKRQSS